MPEFVTDGACLKCSLGAAPGSLTVSAPKVKACGNPIANMADAKPSNIPSFGMCTMTKSKCKPATAFWGTSSNVKVRGLPAVDKSCKAQCLIGGSVEVLSPGQTVANKS